MSILSLFRRKIPYTELARMYDLAHNRAISLSEQVQERDTMIATLHQAVEDKSRLLEQADKDYADLQAGYNGLQTMLTNQARAMHSLKEQVSRLEREKEQLQRDVLLDEHGNFWVDIRHAQEQQVSDLQAQVEHLEKEREQRDVAEAALQQEHEQEKHAHGEHMSSVWADLLETKRQVEQLQDANATLLDERGNSATQLDISRLRKLLERALALLMRAGQRGGWNVQREQLVKELAEVGIKVDSK